MVRWEAGRLGDVRGRLLAWHIGHCDECRLDWEAQLRLAGELRSRSATPDVDFEALWERVSPSLGRQETARENRRGWLPGGLALAGMAVVAAFVFVNKPIAPDRAELASVPPGRLGSPVALPGASRSSIGPQPVLGSKALVATKPSPDVARPRRASVAVRPRITDRPRVAIAMRSPSQESSPAVYPASEPRPRMTASASMGEAGALEARVVADRWPTDRESQGVSWREESTEPLPPMDAVRQASLSRSLFQ